MSKGSGKGLAAAFAAMFLAACGQEPGTPMPSFSATPEVARVPAAEAELSANADKPGQRKAYFGDLHIHTKYSFDAYIFGTRASPDDAYGFAKGAPLGHASGRAMQLRVPLDFAAVTDHATYLGMFEQMHDPSSAVGQHALAIGLRAARTPLERDAIFAEVLPRERGFVEDDDLLDLGVVKGAWQEVVNAAERHNAPGAFTTFVGYEFTAGGRGGENLHRNVLFRDSEVPALPFSRLDAKNNPEKLWQWMDEQRDSGTHLLAIPHNSNGSNGWMFERTDRAGNAINAAYATRRMRNEPLVEVTQVKGTSDTHPLLSPNDEWADFEIMESTIGTQNPSQPQGSYVRQAYLLGLELATAGFNPYQFGLIGSSDTHNAAGSFREDDYWGKTGLLDIQPEQRGSVPAAQTGTYAEVVRSAWGASGLAGVWAEANTRAAIFRAMQRKETFATSGPRVRVRFFAGYDLPADPTSAAGLEAAYRYGVPMGGDLLAVADGRAPQFYVWATQDSASQALQRIQIIKGWVEAGVAKEAVYDVACAAGKRVATNHRCPNNNASVNLQDCSTAADTGAAELRGLWQDPSFDPNSRAFYYVRVLENPSCRWSTWDAINAGQAPNPKLATTIQERAWSSPIWYHPLKQPIKG
ncbi:MAG: DUF3604 domain-containing protein [Pseudomonadales bacterium]